jgi:hypothetical protein
MESFLSTRSAAVLLIVSLLAFSLTFLPGPWVPRFTCEPLNYWFTGVSALAIPASLLTLGLALRSLWPGVALILLAVLSAVPLAPFSFFAMMAASDQADPSHSHLWKLDEASRQHYKYRLYRTDCGATCSYGLELRKEVDVIHVVKLISPVWSTDGEKSATLRFTPAGHLQVIQGERILFTHSE